MPTPGEPSTGSPPPVDLDVLREYIGSDPEVLRAFAQNFLESARRAAVECADACAKGDGRAVAEVAHRFKSVASYMGSTPMVALFLELEEAGRGGDLAEVRRRLPGLEALITASADHLQQHAAPPGTAGEPDPGHEDPP